MTSIEKTEQEINAIYKWWAIQAPGVTPQETGHLAALWSEFDRLAGEGVG